VGLLKLLQVYLNKPTWNIDFHVLLQMNWQVIWKNKSCKFHFSFAVFWLIHPHIQIS